MKLDINKIANDFSLWMSGSHIFGLTTGEWQYSFMKPRIIIERYLSMIGEDVSLIDYKIHCMNGKVFGCLTIFDRGSGANNQQFDHYDVNWNRTEYIVPSYHPRRRWLEKPKNLERMLKIAEDLSAGFEYCRVDLYNIEGTILFGELTFTTSGNVMPFYTMEAARDMQKFYEDTKINL